MHRGAVSGSRSVWPQTPPPRPRPVCQPCWPGVSLAPLTVPANPDPPYWHAGSTGPVRVARSPAPGRGRRASHGTAGAHRGWRLDSAPPAGGAPAATVARRPAHPPALARRRHRRHRRATSFHDTGAPLHGPRSAADPHDSAAQTHGTPARVRDLVQRIARPDPTWRVPPFAPGKRRPFPRCSSSGNYWTTMRWAAVRRGGAPAGSTCKHAEHATWIQPCYCILVRRHWRQRWSQRCVSEREVCETEEEKALQEQAL